MEFKKLGEIADILISNVDKKTKENEYPVKLCNFVDVYYNWSISSYHYQNLMNATATKQEIDKFSIREGDVAITKDSETRDDIGVSTYISESLKNTLLGYHCVLIRPNKNVILGKYLNIVLHSSYAQKYFEANAGGSGQRYTLKDTIIKDMLIPIPSIEEQEQLGNLANSIDKKIENNNKINAELESLAKTIYDYWFLQFEFPNEEGKPYKSSGGKMVWNEELKREIPEGWRKGSLSDICSITMGASPNGESLNENQNGLIFYQGKADFSFRFPSIRMFTTSPIRYAKKNDVLISVRAPVGDLNIANNDCCIGRGLAALHSSYPSYLYYKMVSSKNLFSYYNQNGTTFGAVTKENLHNLEIVVPNEKTIMLFEKTISPLDKKISILSQENQELSSLRDFLLPMLMNGQISFSDDI